MGTDDIAALFEDVEGDPFWQQTELMAGARLPPAAGYVTCSLGWLARALPVVRSAEQLAVLLLLYRRCLMARSRTVDLPNGELRALGISRRTKYRALAWLEEAGAVGAVEEVPHGRSVRVTLHWFP
jgi:hypothetical protein